MLNQWVGNQNLDSRPLLNSGTINVPVPRLDTLSIPRHELFGTGRLTYIDP